MQSWGPVCCGEETVLSHDGPFSPRLSLFGLRRPKSYHMRSLVVWDRFRVELLLFHWEEPVEVASASGLDVSCCLSRPVFWPFSSGRRAGGRPWICWRDNIWDVGMTWCLTRGAGGGGWWGRTYSLFLGWFKPGRGEAEGSTEPQLQISWFNFYNVIKQTAMICKSNLKRVQEELCKWEVQKSALDASDLQAALH